MSVTEGYVKKAGRWRHALRMADGKVASYPIGGGDGSWCGKKISKTFYAIPWNRYSDEEIGARVAFMEMLERIMPSLSGWYGRDRYECKICGATLTDRIIHWRWHNTATIMHETLTSIFPLEEVSHE